MKKNGPSPSPLFDEFVKTLPPYGDPRDAEIAALRQQLAECERERELYKVKAVIDDMPMSEVEGRLMEQLATVTSERDGIALLITSTKTELQEQLATVTKERDELAMILKWVDKYVSCAISPEIKTALAKLGADKEE